MSAWIRAEGAKARLPGFGELVFVARRPACYACFERGGRVYTVGLDERRPFYATDGNPGWFHTPRTEIVSYWQSADELARHVDELINANMQSAIERLQVDWPAAPAWGQR